MEEKKSWLDKVGGKKEKKSKVLSREDEIIKSNADLCYKVVGRDSTGREAYYFVLIDKNKKAAFLKNRVGDSYNLEDYGKIIYSAYGSEVPAKVKKMLKEKYGFDNLGE